MSDCDAPDAHTPNTTAKVESRADLQTHWGTLRGIMSIQRGDRSASLNL